ncbi:two-component system response regulator YesN [Paenibacillus xylanexedens]|uniref:response regulator transcription factor n=1 Tax=Paenibacillus xylanexedens TaxID=528191 RepID=UPI00209C7A40|nr:response regulator [Paenibacillus xylanexedens]MCP1421961.1 two-component system response regulator YesN [Paenibacillus xylanexedens]
MYTYIVVDDEPLIRKGLLKKIGTFEHSLELLGEADNGADALALIESFKPDIIFTDMRMPEVDGKLLIRTVCQQYPRIKLIVISGHTDFDYMQEAISAKVVNYLLKPFNRDEIHGTLHQAIQAIEQERSLQREVVLREVETEQMKRDADMQAFLNYVLAPHSSIKTPVFRSAEFAAIMASDQFILLTIYGPQPLTAQQLPTFSNGLYIPHPQTDQVLFFLMHDLDCSGQLDLQKMAEQTASIILTKSETTDCCVGISLPHTGIGGVREAHHQTILALDERAITDFGKCYVFSREQFPLHQLKWARTYKLLFFIESGNVPKVEELITDFFAFYIRQPDALLAHLKEQCRDIITETKRLLSNYIQNGGNSSASSSLEAVLNVSFDMECIRHYMVKVLTGTALLLKEDNPYASDQVIDNVRTYIDNHYTKDLTLEWVSSLFYLNPSYLSHLFKEKTSENFTDYVNRLRIRQAKQLLTSTDDKIYRVAKQLGYDNPKYFFRVFKKLTGWTPEEYRKQHKSFTANNKEPGHA